MINKLMNDRHSRLKLVDLLYATGASDDETFDFTGHKVKRPLRKYLKVLFQSLKHTVFKPFPPIFHLLISKVSAGGERFHLLPLTSCQLHLPRIIISYVNVV